LEKLSFVKDALLAVPTGNYRIVALHHPLLLEERSLLPGGLLERFLDWGVDMILCGHAHFRLAQTLTDGKGRSLILSQCGTSTSSRGRADQQGKNSIHEIVLSDQTVTVRLLEFSAGANAFTFTREENFPRKAK
jgi:hypothetical protein